MMQTFARNYAGLFNGRHGRSGTLWEGRYKSCLVDSESYVLTCCRYIELNPVRAWMVGSPSEHPWSSYHANALGKPDPLVTPHAVMLALGHDPADRAAGYRALFAEVLTDEVVAEIRAYLQQQRALGTDRFRAQVEAKLKRFAGVRPAHRPKRQAEDVPHESVSDTVFAVFGRGDAGAVSASAADSIDDGAYTMKIARITSGFAKLFQLALLCALLVTAAGCSRMSLKWKEEVRLSSGQLIAVDRTAQGTITRDIAMRATGWKPKEMTLRISQAGLGVQAPPAWRSILIPVVLDYDPATSTWSVLATYLFCSTWYDMGRPQSPYVQYISRHDEPWRVVPLQPGWVGRWSNLLTHIRPTGEPALVREVEKEVARRKASDRFKAISTSWKTNC